MGEVIHANKAGNGYMYRLWNDNVNSYVTEVMNEADLRDELLGRDLLFAAQRYKIDIEHRIDRAQKNGTSEYGGKREMIRWGEVLEPDPDDWTKFSDEVPRDGAYIRANIVGVDGVENGANQMLGRVMDGGNSIISLRTQKLISMPKSDCEWQELDQYQVLELLGGGDIDGNGG